MKRWMTSGLLVLAVGWFGAGCQSEKQSRLADDAPVQPATASLAKPTYAIGDSVTILLTQPLRDVAVFWNSTFTLVNPLARDSLRIRANNKTVGMHQLIVRGTLPNAHSIADTLTIELLSDIVPQAVAYTVVTTYPHDTASFTQGLEFHRGVLYESTGLNGRSRLMTIDLPTGRQRQSVSLLTQHFGEGITILNDKIYQLTWTSGLCFRYNLAFKLEKTLVYHTQGWGLTYRDSTLIMSDGSNRLYLYTPEFRLVRMVSVYDHTGPVTNLNELEYVNGAVFSNIWQTNRIAQIDLNSGKVVGYLTLDSLVPATIDPKEAVLNGVAYNPSDQTLFVTGKNWPTLTQLRLKPIPRPMSAKIARR